MTTKFTKQKIQQIISEECEKLLNEVSMKGLKTLVDLARGGNFAGKLSKLTTDVSKIMNDSAKLRKAGEKIGDVVVDGTYYIESAAMMRQLASRITKLKKAGGKDIPAPDLENLTGIARSLRTRADQLTAHGQKLRNAKDAAAKAASNAKKAKKAAAKANKNALVPVGETSLAIIGKGDEALEAAAKAAKSGDEAGTQLAKIADAEPSSLNKIKGNKKAEKDFAIAIYNKQKKAPTSLKTPGKVKRAGGWKKWLAAAGLILASGFLIDLMKKGPKKVIARPKATTLYCRRLRKTLMQTKYGEGVSYNRALKTLQEDLVNLGFPVTKDRKEVPFGLAKCGGGMVKQLNSEYAKYGIDGKCGTGTRRGIEALQDYLSNEMGYDLGEYGPQKDGVDGLMGTVTVKGLQQLAADIASGKIDPCKDEEAKEEEIQDYNLKIAYGQGGKRWDDIMNTFVAAEHGVYKHMMKRGREQFKVDANDPGQMKDLKELVVLSIGQIGFPTLMNQRRISIYGKDMEAKGKAAKDAALVLDKMLRTPEFFTNRAKQMNLSKLIADPQVIKNSAVAAMRRILSNTSRNMDASITEWNEFDKFSRLWD